MLAITPQTLIYLRTGQQASDAFLRQKLAEKRKAEPRRMDQVRFRQLVDKAACILRTGESTKFEFEGACRHGIRSALCLGGWPWSDADAAAAAIVAKALNQIGAVRPTWDQGQPDYAVAYGSQRSRCARCDGPIAEDRGSSNGTPVKFCSDLCAHNAMAERKRISGEKVSLAEYLATCVARTERTMQERAAVCQNPACGRLFPTKDRDRKYCSRKCWDAREKLYPERVCERPECGNVFTPKNSGKSVSRYCSRECANLSRRKVRPALTCQNPDCRTIFYPDFPSDKRKYCSDACRPEAVRRLAALRWRCEEV
jgi:hypothetical protein